MDSTTLVDVLKDCSSRDEASLSSLDMTDSEFITYVIPSLAGANWSKIHLCENNIGDASLRCLASFLSVGNHSLFELDLGWNQITDNGVSHLAAVLPLCSIRDLVLHSNEITDAGIEELAAVVTSSTLQTLDLCANAITDSGAFALAAIIADSSLRSLDLSQTRITNLGAGRLLDSMRRSKLSFLNLIDTEVNSQGLFDEIEKTEELTKSAFPNIVSLCSVRTVPRLGGRSVCRVLPTELLRRIATMLYRLSDPFSRADSD